MIKGARPACLLLPCLLAGCGFFGGKHSPAPPPDTARSRDGGIPYPDIRDSLELAYQYPNLDSGAWGRDTGARAPGPAWLDSARPWTRPQPPPPRPGIKVKPRPRELPGWARVLLQRGPKPVALYSIGDLDLWAQPAPTAATPAADSAASTTLSPPAARPAKLMTLRGRISLRRVGTGIEISQGAKVIQTVATRRLRLISANPYNLLEVGEYVYRGGLEVVADAEGGLLAVNVVGMEDYLRGVLPYELGTVDREALEALKALAVAARTYAYRRMLANPNGDFHLYNDVQDQVYRGVKSEYLLSDRAVRETRGLVIQFGDTMITPYYHSTCGGRTASRHEVWGGDSLTYLTSRPDTDALGQSYCAASKFTNWTREWTAKDLAGILLRNLKSAGVGDFAPFKSVKSLQVTVRASCGRIRTLRIDTDKGPIWVKGDKVRWALREPASEEKILPSAWLDIKGEGDRIIAQGRGFGHGIGLCQFGAIGRARADQTFMQIIEAYYKGAQVVELR